MLQSEVGSRIYVLGFRGILEVTWVVTCRAACTPQAQLWTYFVLGFVAWVEAVSDPMANNS